MRKKRESDENYHIFEGETPVGDIDAVCSYEKAGDPVELKDKIEMERLIYFLTAEETTVLLLRHLGFKPAEIYVMMGLPKISRYYKIYRSMQTHIELFKMFEETKNKEKN